MSLDKLINKDKFTTLLKYGLSCSFVLISKIALTACFMTFLTGSFAYLLTHVLTFFISYETHTRFSFTVEKSELSLLKYFRTVIFFKVLDFLTFSVVFEHLKINAPISIIIASGLIFIIRFVFVKKALVHNDS